MAIFITKGGGEHQKVDRASRHASGLCVTQQKEIDELMLMLDETGNKSKLGANAILGVSLAVCKAGAAKKGIPHAGNKLATQEFMILPTGASSFTEAMKIGTEVYHHLKNVIKAMFGLDATTVGDEDAIAKAGYTGKVEIGVDVAASEFHKDGKYDLDFKNPKSDKSAWLSSDFLEDMYHCFIKDFPIVSLEDPFHQDHWSASTKITANIRLHHDPDRKCRVCTNKRTTGKLVHNVNALNYDDIGLHALQSQLEEEEQYRFTRVSSIIPWKCKNGKITSNVTIQINPFPPTRSTSISITAQESPVVVTLTHHLNQHEPSRPAGSSILCQRSCITGFMT
ncbi:conserved hypothetical protein [Culex quinquefasciatus]|uniref:Enolase n=1 Tax=Culex quinquefasciatus TaxID=7176 RepID=B0XJ83_CULQU|nr:conserved hypothetical protein [Culex quinquefasciatus]|eukprot:XP_001869705.1 conserved hypothetical protein [Culex quinquefasciatus]